MRPTARKREKFTHTIDAAPFRETSHERRQRHSVSQASAFRNRDGHLPPVDAALERRDQATPAARSLPGGNQGARENFRDRLTGQGWSRGPRCTEIRCRTVSYMSMPAATETFRLSTAP